MAGSTRTSTVSSPRGITLSVVIGNEWRQSATRLGHAAHLNEWTLFLRPAKGESGSRFADLVRRVVFRPASGFNPVWRPQVVQIDAPGPYELKNKSVAVFDAAIELHLDPSRTSQPIHHFVHPLQFGAATFFRRHLLRLPFPGEQPLESSITPPPTTLPTPPPLPPVVPTPPQAAPSGVAHPRAARAVTAATAAAERDRVAASGGALPGQPSWDSSHSSSSERSDSKNSTVPAGSPPDPTDSSRRTRASRPPATPAKPSCELPGLTPAPPGLKRNSLSTPKVVSSCSTQPPTLPPYEGTTGGTPAVDFAVTETQKTGTSSPSKRSEVGSAFPTLSGRTFGSSEPSSEIDAVVDAIASAVMTATRVPQQDADVVIRALRADPALRNRVDEAVSNAAARIRAPAAGARPGKEVPLSELRMGSVLGSGHFGCVRHAEWRSLPVAVKEVLEPSDAYRFGDEVASLLSLRHPNIVAYLGHAWGVSGSLLLITEYCVGGSLETHLATRAAGGHPLCIAEVLDVARDVAQAMHYLECEGKVHRDLACRNVFVSASGIASLSCKVGDFGLARDLAHPDGQEDASPGDTPCEMEIRDPHGWYTRSPGGAAFPIWWSAPEAVRSQTWTHSSDVWSYGVLLWEVLDYALRVPYRDTHGDQAGQALGASETLPMPKGCPELVWNRLCLPPLRGDPGVRPTFSTALETALKLRSAASRSLEDGCRTLIPIPGGASRADLQLYCEPNDGQTG
eukprot:TRINITY_DN654_c0_g1_i11.p1 TRINITY_DN654_c0_g1~~TRINITY_DN654_c0_g1_i11.p1  ORF type:complete len:791 (+),score=133.50 TRINITY_DN654_c0_g1_i11:162-2375(+)